MVHKTKVNDFIGWCGVILILSTYALVSFGILNVSGLLYPALNILGSACIIVETSSKKDYQPTVLNIIWLLIALIAVIRFII